MLRRTPKSVGTSSSCNNANSSPASKIKNKEKAAFLSDEQVGGSFLFTFITLLLLPLAIIFHDFADKGVPQVVSRYQANKKLKKGTLFIGTHSTHNQDILSGIAMFYQRTGIAPRALFHRWLFYFFPWLRNLGGVPGYRDTASAMLNDGYAVAVIPGGADEPMQGHEKAYEVCWPKGRKGFARVAMNTKSDIVPFFTRNGEEMRWNPFFSLGNFLRLGVVANFLMGLPYPLGTFFNRLFVVIWFTLSWLAIPIPVRAEVIFGDPVAISEDDSLDTVVEKSRQALQELIDTHQKRRHRDIPAALWERFSEKPADWWKNFVADYRYIKPEAAAEQVDLLHSSSHIEGNIDFQAKDLQAQLKQQYETALRDQKQQIEQLKIEVAAQGRTLKTAEELESLKTQLESQQRQLLTQRQLLESEKQQFETEKQQQESELRLQKSQVESERLMLQAQKQGQDHITTLFNANEEVD